MVRGVRVVRRGRAWLALVVVLIAGMATLACSGNRRVSVGGSMYMSSSGSWGHSISVGIQSHGRRR